MTDIQMQPRDLVLTAIHAAKGRKDLGRTSLQKVTYLTGIYLGVDLGHSAYYYGPYSATIEADTEALVTSGLVDETSHQMGENARGFPLYRYEYQITKDGEERVQALTGKYEQTVKKVDELVGRLVEVVGSLDQNTLAAAAKTLYIAREQGDPVTTERIGELASDLGWTLTPTRITAVSGLLHDLKFVEITE